MNTDQPTLIAQMTVLFQLLDRDWEQHFRKFTVTKVSIIDWFIASISRLELSHPNFMKFSC
jgi:hypothetical protein